MKNGNMIAVMFTEDLIKFLRRTGAVCGYVEGDCHLLYILETKEKNYLLSFRTANGGAFSEPKL